MSPRRRRSGCIGPSTWMIQGSVMTAVVLLIRVMMDKAVCRLLRLSLWSAAPPASSRSTMPSDMGVAAWSPHCCSHCLSLPALVDRLSLPALVEEPQPLPWVPRSCLRRPFSSKSLSSEINMDLARPLQPVRTPQCRWQGSIRRRILPWSASERSLESTAAVANLALSCCILCSPLLSSSYSVVLW